MPSQPSRFTELLGSERLKRHTFSSADVRLEDILAAEAAQATTTTTTTAAAAAAALQRSTT
ncbi:hypothetical protein RJ035_008060, partial [Blastomyces gilchristii]